MDDRIKANIQLHSGSNRGERTSAQRFKRTEGLENYPLNRKSVPDLKLAHVYAIRAAAVAAAAPPRRAAAGAASRPPGESRAIHRISGSRCHLQTALDHGNNFLHQEGATGAAIGRNHESPLAPGLPRGIAAPAMAIAKGQTRRPGAQSRCFGDPAEEKKQPRNS